jgi:TRAP-type mannitol/chloroaromatic compound transport system permease large subunit
VGFLALCALILFQVPIGFAMLGVGLVGYALQAGWSPALTLLASETSGLLASVDLATVPLFLLMGTFASAAGFSRDIYRAAAAWFGHRRGGLAYATIGGCAAFAAAPPPPPPPPLPKRPCRRCCAGVIHPRFPPAPLLRGVRSRP